MDRLVAIIALTIFSLTAASAQVPSEDALYHYRAIVTDVYDGDTVTVDVDLGFHVWVRDQRIRLAQINAPELTGDSKVEGIAARDFLRGLVLGRNVIVQTIKAPSGADKKEKYGRYLGVIWLDQVNINDLLVTKGHAIRRDYR